MKCYKCRTEVPEGAKFCFKCGAEQGFPEDLIRRAMDGEQEAITELYNRTYNNAYYTVKALIKDEDTALDIIQDSYVKAFKSLNQLKEADKFRAWVKRICHNHAVDYLRKTKPVMFSAMSTDDEKVVEFEDDRTENLPEEAMEQKETSRLIKEILDSLSDEQRLVVGMFYYEQLSVKEIAETLSLNENTIKSRLNYARKKIEERVTKLEKEQGIRLHSLAPIPFLLWLFRSQDVQAAEIPKVEMLSALQQECVKYSSKSVSAPSDKVMEESLKTGTEKISKAIKTGSEMTKTATGMASKGLATKIIAGVVAVAVLGGGATVAYKAMNSNQPESQPTEAVETVQETYEEKVYSEWLGNYVADVNGESVTLSVLLAEKGEFAYSLANEDDDFVTQGIPTIQGNKLQIGDRVFVFSKDSVTYSGNILDDTRHENVVFHRSEDVESEAALNEETSTEDISRFEGYYISSETSLGITIKAIDGTTANVSLVNISPDGANAFNQEGQAYLDDGSLIMDMETSDGDIITFTLEEDEKLIVHASEHYQARANTYISGTYYLSSYQENEESVNLDDYVGEYMNGQDWNAGTLNIEKRDEKYLYVKLQGFRNRGEQELSTVFEGVAEPENITEEGITINIYGEDVNLVKTDFGFKLNVSAALRNQLGFDSYLYDNEYFSTAPY